jgi:hypothetical protein
MGRLEGGGREEEEKARCVLSLPSCPYSSSLSHRPLGAVFSPKESWSWKESSLTGGCGGGAGCSTPHSYLQLAEPSSLPFVADGAILSLLIHAWWPS